MDGEVVSAGDEEFEAADLDAEEDDTLPDWQRESVDKLRSILDSEDWIEVPDLNREFDEYHVMQRFADSLSDQRIGERLRDAMIGNGAYGRAKKVMIDAGIRDEWYLYRQREAESLARNWLTSEGFEVE